MKKMRWLGVCALLLTASAWAGATPNGLVILLTDYGVDSIYVGALKGAIYAKFPQARIDTITNSVPAFDVVTGAFMLVEACREFPEGTTFCCVVDPGVGTPRKCVALKTESGQVFVGPDNGLLSLVGRKYGTVEVRECTNQALWREGKISHTFHGRDIFGPVAASLAGGVPFKDAGPTIDGLTALESTKAEVAAGLIRGTVTYVDGYGNMITNIGYEDLAGAGFKKSDVVEVTIGKAKFDAPLEETYSDVPKGSRLGLVQSLGYLEFAVNMGSLGAEIKEEAHAPVEVRKK